MVVGGGGASIATECGVWQTAAIYNGPEESPWPTRTHRKEERANSRKSGHKEAAAAAAKRVTLIGMRCH